MALQEFSKKYLDVLMFVPSFCALPAIFVLNLNEALLLLSAGKSIIAPLAFKAGSSYSIVINFLIFLNDYRCILLYYSLSLLYQYLLHYLLVYCLFHLCNYYMEHNF